MTVITSRKLIIPGCGIIEKGTELKVIEHNSKFVYVQINNRSIRLSKDKDVGKSKKFR